MNIVLQNSYIPDRYPLNQLSAMIVNVFFSYVVYLLPVFFPKIIWLGLAPILFGFGQFGVHGIATNRKLKSIYNPGLGAVVFLHFPIGIYYIIYVTRQNLINATDWLFAIIYLVFLMMLLNVVTYKIMPNKNTKYIFDDVEMERFNVKEKMSKIK